MIGYKDVATARYSGDTQALNEASLGRVYRHIKDAKYKSLTLITAWRSQFAHNENQRRNKRLMNDIRSTGAGAFKLIGVYKYKDGTADEEDSFGVIGLTRDNAVKLMKRYDQEAIVYLGPETDGEAMLIFSSGDVNKLGEFDPMKVADAYSRIRNAAFRFESFGFDYPFQSFIEGVIDSLFSNNSGIKK